VEYFIVTEIVDGDTFKVSPNWKWNSHTGDTVRPKGYDTPEIHERGYQEAKDRPSSLLSGEKVGLAGAVKITYGRILCDVYVNGKNLADYFPEYQV
jgi:endonuclease YncB( thermonuclease family)